jgi:hypothetical protein
MKKFIVTFIFLALIIMPKHIYTQQWESCNSGSKNELLYTTFFASCDQSIIGATFTGLFRSTDNSDTWTKIDNGITDKSITSFCKKGSILFAGTENGGVFMSNDNGATWTEKNNGLTFKKTQKIVTIDNNLFVGTYGGGVFMSNDDGESWTDIGTSLKGEEKKIYRMAVFEDKLFIGTYSEGVFMTSDNGMNWKKLNTGLDNLWITSFVYYDSTLYISTINQFDASNGGIFKSTNLGEKWTLLKYDNIREQIYCLQEVDGVLIAGTLYGRIYCSKDKGKKWYTANDGLPSGSSIANIAYNDEYVFISNINKGIFKFKRSILGVEDNFAHTDISLSPNPAGDFITVSLKQSEGFEPSEVSEIQIYNTLGEKVMSVSARHAVPLQINIDHLPKGMYFLKVGGETAKFVKM